MIKWNHGFSRKFSIFFFVLFLALVIAGCGPNAEEKARISSDIEYMKTEIDIEIARSNRILADLSDYKARITNLEKKRSFKANEKAKYRYELEKYILDHKEVYCIFHTCKCIEFAVKIAWYAGEISAIDNRIYELEKKACLLKQEYNDYEESIDALRARLKEEQERWALL